MDSGATPPAGSEAHSSAAGGIPNGALAESRRYMVKLRSSQGREVTAPGHRHPPAGSSSRRRDCTLLMCQRAVAARSALMAHRRWRRSRRPMPRFPRKSAIDCPPSSKLAHRSRPHPSATAQCQGPSGHNGGCAPDAATCQMQSMSRDAAATSAVPGPTVVTATDSMRLVHRAVRAARGGGRTSHSRSSLLGRREPENSSAACCTGGASQPMEAARRSDGHWREPRLALTYSSFYVSKLTLTFAVSNFVPVGIPTPVRKNTKVSFDPLPNLLCLG